MTAIRITNFSGIIPMIAERQLPDNAAQMAANTKLASGELRPMRKSKKVYALDSALAVPILSLFKVDADTWFCWPQAGVKVARAAVEGEARFCYTGDGVPKITTKALGAPVAVNGTPAAARALGIPSPLSTPIVTPSGGVGAAVTRYYWYTFYSDWNEEGAPAPVSALTTGKVDSTWAITGMDDVPANSGGIANITYVGTTVTLTASGNHFNRVGDSITIAGVTTVANVNGTWVLTAINAAAKTMTFTVLTPPTGAYNNATDTTDTWTRVVPWGTCTKRLYRTAGTLAGAQLVAEGITGTTYNDTLTDALIPGDEMISAAWVPPPAELQGLVALPNGGMAGYYGKLVYFFEPYQPHACPVEYQKRTHFPISGIAALADGSVVVVTEGMPYYVSGYEPASMVMERIEEPLPCLSSASVCSVGDSAVYATRGGLAMVGPAGRGIFTAELFSDEDWYALEPETMRCAYTRGSVYLVSSADPMQVFVIGVNPGSAGPVVTAPLRAGAVHVDETSGRIYYALLTSVFEFDPDDGVPLMQNWFSKEFVVGQPINLGAAKVSFSEEYTAQAQVAFDAELATIIAENATMIATGEARGGINATRTNRTRINGSLLAIATANTPTLAFILYADGRQRCYRLVTQNKPFRLPAGYKADTFSVRVMSNMHVRSVELAETVIGLKQV